MQQKVPKIQVHFSGAIPTEPGLQKAVRERPWMAAILGPPAQILLIGPKEELHAQIRAKQTVLLHAPPGI